MTVDEWNWIDGFHETKTDKSSIGFRSDVSKLPRVFIAAVSSS